MSYVDVGNINSMLQSILASSPALQAYLKGLNPTTTAAATTPGATTAASAPTASLPTAVAGPTPTTPIQTSPQANVSAPSAPAAPAATVAPGINPAGDTSDSNYNQRYAGGGIITGNSIDASTLTGLPLEAQSAADPSKGWGTPYYAAKTDQGDTAATLNAAAGARTELIDPATGNVVAYGVGPQGSDEIASLASAISQKEGKQAVWDIAQETGDGTGQFQTFYGDRVDKPRFTLLTALKDILPAAAGMLLGPEVGGLIAGATGLGTTAAGALGAGLTSFGTGLATGQTPLASLIDGAGAGIGSGVGSALGGAGSTAASGSGIFSNIPGAFDSSAVNLTAGLGGVAPGALGGAATGLFDASTALGGLTAGLGGTGGGALGDVIGNGLNNPQAGAGGVAGGGAGGVPGVTDLSGITVNAPSGASGAAGGAGAAGAGIGAGVTDLSGITVNAPSSSSGPTINPAAGIGASVPGLTTLADVTPNDLQTPQQAQDAKTGSNAGKSIADLINSLTSGGSGGGGGSTSTKSTTPDPFTPGGGSTNPSPTGNTSPGGTNGGGPGTSGGPGSVNIHFSSPSLSAPAAGSVTGSPFGGGGAGAAGLGSIALKGSAAPDIYPWSTVV